MQTSSANPFITTAITAAQDFLTTQSLPGWLVYDYRDSNPIFRQLITPSGHVTRQVFLFIPAQGEAKLLVHHVDAGKFTESGVELVIYRHRDSMLQALEQVLAGAPEVAMEYSPQNSLPRVSRVDAGTVEMVRSFGVNVVSSADLMQHATQRWTPQQLEGHTAAAAKLGEIVGQAFHYIGAHLEQGPTEYEVAEFIRRRFREEDLETADGPIVSTNSHCSDPHYEPGPQGSSVISRGDWVLIDLWAKAKTEASVYADITWVAYVGDGAPPRHQEIFDIVAGARDAALSFLEESFQKNEIVQGWQADAVARDYIAERGYSEYFTHRLGHSIGHEVHSEAVNLDGFETHDTRPIIPGVGFSIEPGIYLPEFGVRSEIDAFMSDSGPYATSPVQREIALIRGG